MQKIDNKQTNVFNDEKDITNLFFFILQGKRTISSVTVFFLLLRLIALLLPEKYLRLC
tara:strand:- start:1281 stop:1454 length:174 start_codon:yes stop_codon:yes gene_type:complete